VAACAGAGVCRVFFAILAQKSRSHLIQQLLQAASILQGAFEDGDHGLGDIEAPALPLFSESQQVVGMLFPGGTSLAVGPDAGFIDFRERPFQGGPQGEQFFQAGLLKEWAAIFMLHQAECNLVCMHIQLYA
jgi:hypothetical protein